MKFIAGVFLILALLDSFHCAPLIGSDDGTYKETETFSSWGYNVGLDANLGLEGGFKDGQGSLGIYNHIGANVGGHKRNGQKDINHPIYIPHYGQQYIPQYAVPYVSQYPPQWPQGAPHYIPQGSPQYIPQGAPQYIPQYAPQGVPQYTPQVPPQHVPQSTPKSVTQKTPQGAPKSVTQKTTQSDTTAAPLDETQYGA